MAVLTKITSRSLGDNSVTAAKIQADALGATDLAPNSVGASELANDAVDTAALANDAVTAAKIDDDGTGYTFGDMTIGSGGTSWSLPTSRGSNDKYVLQINSGTGAATWEESLTAPEIQSVANLKINKYEAPYEYTGTTNSTTTISSLSSTTGLVAGQYISGSGIPANTTISSINTGASTLVLSQAATSGGSGVALKIQKTPGEKNGGSVTFTGTNFGSAVGELTASIVQSGGSVIAQASYLSGLSGGTTLVAEWTGTEGTYAQHLNPSHGSYIGDSGVLYLKLTKSGLASNVLNTSTTLTSDPTLPNSGVPTQSDGVPSTPPTASSLGVYGGRIKGGGQDPDIRLLLNFDRAGGKDIEDSSNTTGNGVKSLVNGHAMIVGTPFGDGKSALVFDGTNDKLNIANTSLGNFTNEDFTIEFWMLSNQSGAKRLMSKGTHAAGQWFIRGKSNESEWMKFYTGNSTGFSITTAGHNYTADGAWHHVAVCRDFSAGTLIAYVDGIEVTRNSGTGNNAGGTFQVSAANAGVGIGTGINDGSSEFYQGYLDEIRISNNVRYTANFTPSTTRFTQDSNTKFLLHSNDDFTSVDMITASGSTSTTTGWSNMRVDGTAHGSHAITHIAASDGKPALIKINNGANAAQLFTTKKITGLNASKVYSISTDIYSSTDTGGMNTTLYVGTDNNDTSSTNVSGISDNLSAKTYGSLRLGTLRSDSFTGTTFVYVTLKTNANVNTYTEHADVRIHNWTDDSPSPHTIGVTEVCHDPGTGKGAGSWLGLGPFTAPVIARPNSRRKTGTNGMYFDGTGDYIQNTGWSAIGTGKFTIEFWMKFGRWDGTGNYMPIMGQTQGSAGFLNINLKRTSSGTVGSTHTFYAYNGSQLDSNYVVSDGAWHHMVLSRDASNNLKFWVDGQVRHTVGSHTHNYSSTQNWAIGWDNVQNHYFKGYLDMIRIAYDDRFADSTDQLYSSNGTTYTIPTTAYGYHGDVNPSVGTITLSATSTTGLDFSSVGTSLPSGLSLAEGTDDGNTRKGTITGTFTGAEPASDTATSNILIKAQDPNDNTRAITFNDTTGMNITRRISERPKLFGVRRWWGKRGASDNIVPTDQIKGYGFKPNFVWIKRRSGASTNMLWSSLLGPTKVIHSDSTTAVETENASRGVVSFDDDGFTLGGDTNVSGQCNRDGERFVGWCWKAGDSFTPTAGNYTSPVGTRNVAGGFSMVKVTANSSAAGSTVTHGLSSTPEFIMAKSVSNAYNWDVWHKDMTGGATTQKRLILNTNAAESSNMAWAWNVTSTTFATGGNTHHGTGEQIFFIFHSVAGVSKVHYYTGTGATTLMTTERNIGFVPRFIMVKGTHSSEWVMLDKSRAGSTATGWHYHLTANNANAEDTNPVYDFEEYSVGSDRGWQLGTAVNTGNLNTSGQKYLYIAFA